MADQQEWERMTHRLKCWPLPYLAVRLGNKLHEIRKNDRDYQSGDTVILEAWDPQDEKYTGSSMTFTIGHVSAGGTWGLPDDLCVFSLLKSSPSSPSSPSRGEMADDIGSLRGLLNGVRGVISDMDQSDERDTLISLVPLFEKHICALQSSPNAASGGAESRPSDDDLEIGRRVVFIGVYPLDPTARAALPMIPDSWRFKFTKNEDGSLYFGPHDEGDFVAWKAVEPFLSSPPQEASKRQEWPMEVQPEDMGLFTASQPSASSGREELLEAFERWVLKTPLGVESDRFDLTKDSLGQYISSDTRSAWRGYYAATQSQDEPKPIAAVNVGDPRNVRRHVFTMLVGSEDKLKDGVHMLYAAPLQAPEPAQAQEPVSLEILVVNDEGFELAIDRRSDWKWEFKRDAFGNRARMSSPPPAQQEAAGAMAFKIPRTPQEAVDFIGHNFAGRDERGEMENWLFTLSIHDLLSAFSWWEDMWPDASIPSPAPQQPDGTKG